MKIEKIKLKNISAKSWEHPTDKAALSALESIPGMDTILKKFVGATTEKSIKLATLASAVRTSEKQFPKLYNLHKEACQILDLPYIPELYIAQHPFMNAGATGVENPFIVLNSSVLDKLSDEEILAVIGHELGHCMSGHVLYKTLLYMLINLSTLMLSVPLSGIAIAPIILALKEWDRKSELSADRAGLLVVQDPMTYYSLLMKMAGGADYSQMDVNEFFLQAAEYENMSGLSDSVYKMLNVMTLSHPFPVLRLTKLKTWVDSGEYEKVLSEKFIERGIEDNHFENFSSAGKQYKEDIKNTKGPLAGVTSSIFDAVDSMTDQATDLKDRAGNAWDTFFDKDEPKTR
ncbi:MAG: Zn-dependent protease with chaperone function [SAR324 cluster bacterium]|uniref:Zn-dependent protease with chaperone function n=1 Tax=SAR324 cluster bacterium TaxID=2024889 RepID=A0A2A4SZG7_9DELT|nr:MAG: Zn-dependent protease with chaperone function [SAR324 cluster bacterium]